MVTSGDQVREGLSSVTRGTLFLLVATLCYVGVNFVSRVIVIRSISMSEWSAFSLALALAGVISAVGTLGLPSAVARSLPYSTSDAERRSMVRGSLWIAGASGLVGTVALFLSAPAIGTALGSASLPASELTLALQLFSVTIATGVISTVIASIFQGYEDVTPNALFLQILQPTLFVVFLVGVVVQPPHHVSYVDALATYAVSNVAALVLVVVYAARRLPRRLPPGPTAPGALRNLLLFAAPLFVVGLMSTLTGSGDTLVLGIYHSGEVGTYTASLTLARLLTIGVSAASYIFLPVATKFIRRNDANAVELTFTTVTKWMILFSLPLFVLFFFLPTESLGFVYGSSYTLITVPLDITVLGAFVTTLLGPGPTTQVAYGRIRLLAYNAVVAGLLNVGIAFLLVPAHGYVGAAIAWASANAAYSALSIFELAVMDRIHPFRPHFVVPLAATGLPLALLFSIYRPRFPWWSLPPIGLAIAGLFVLVILLTRSIDVGDAMLLDALERMVGRPILFLRRLGRLALRRRPAL